MPGNGKPCGVFDAGIPHPPHAWVVQRVGFACPGLGTTVYFGTHGVGVTGRPPAEFERSDDTLGLVWVNYPPAPPDKGMWELEFVAGVTRRRWVPEPVGAWHKIDNLRTEQ